MKSRGDYRIFWKRRVIDNLDTVSDIYSEKKYIRMRNYYFLRREITVDTIEI